jgi:hypothetical protein
LAPLSAGLSSFVAEGEVVGDGVVAGWRGKAFCRAFSGAGEGTDFSAGEANISGLIEAEGIGTIARFSNCRAALLSFFR